MSTKILKKDFVVFSGIIDSIYSFSFSLHHRKGKEIKCYASDKFKSMYSYRDPRGNVLSNTRPKENIEIEILNYQELRQKYLDMRGFSLELPNIDARFCQDMHIFACGGNHYVNYAPIMLDSMETAKFIAELWAMAFVYILLAREDKQALDPNRICEQKNLYHDFLTNCQFSIRPGVLANA